MLEANHAKTTNQNEVLNTFDLTAILGLRFLCRFQDATQSQMFLCSGLPFSLQFFLQQKEFLLQCLSLHEGCRQVMHKPTALAFSWVLGVKNDPVI